MKSLISVSSVNAGSLSKTIPQGTLEGGRRHGRQKKCWMDNIKEWTSLLMPELLTRASCINDLKRLSAESSIMSSRRPNRSRNLTELFLLAILDSVFPSYPAISTRRRDSPLFRGPFSVRLTESPRAHLHLVEMLRFKKTKTILT